MTNQSQIHYRCANGMGVRRSVVELDYATASQTLARQLNSQLGVLLASGFEYPGRYTRWDIGFVNPPIVIEARSREIRINALNQRGCIMLPEIFHALRDNGAIAHIEHSQQQISLSVNEPDEELSEELRSRRPGVFTIVRALLAGFRSEADNYLGLYGAFGYDLTFQFEDVQRFQNRDASQRDLVLYIPDQILVADHRTGRTEQYNYEFQCRNWESESRQETTGGFRRTGKKLPYTPAIKSQQFCDHSPGEFAQQVKNAQDYFRRGDLFEVVPGQSFFEPCSDSPADVFARLQVSNPAPYGALINLGEQEYLVAASPEMFVRVEGREIETCPISGTIKRGTDPLGDAEQIRTLLNSSKDESELSMCTDVDRNDKARVCEPGSVRVVGRRQIEMYSRLIHTVDHVKGTLKQEFDALDAFLAHTWAVTVTGAPKLAAMQFIERYEKSPRRWYGGAMGCIGFNGDMNTGLTLRTVRIKDGIAEIRAGATLLADSDPEAEEQETRLKASALIAALRNETGQADSIGEAHSEVGKGLQALMVDHQDSFVHNLAAYFRQCGVELITLRPEPARRYLAQHNVDLMILSPGPSRPEDFGMADTIACALAKQTPIFGVCLGLQGIVEYFGGSLVTLDYPMHGKPSVVRHAGSALFNGVSQEFTAGRYHSLVAETVPDCLQVTARSEDGSVMAVEHTTLPVAALQFHPESIMTLADQAGQQLIANVLAELVSRKLGMQAG